MFRLFVAFLVCHVAFGRIVIQDIDQSVHQSEHNRIVESNRVPQVLPVQVQSSEVCEVCKLAVEELSAYLNNPDNVKELENLLKSYICKNTGPLEETCDTLADDLESVVHLLQPMLQDPTKACGEISLCGQSPSTDPQLAERFGILMLRNFIPRQASASDVLCDECEFMVGEAKQLFDDKATQNEIKTAVEQVCTYCPKADGCKKFVDDNIEKIFTEIDQFLTNAKGVCTDMGLCSKSEEYNGYYLIDKIDETHPELRTRAIALGNHIQHIPFVQRAAFILTNLQSTRGVSGGCIACEIGFDTILNILKYSNSSRYGMVNLIEDICTIFPTEIEVQCNDFVATYGPAVVDVTLRTLNGKSICDDIKACTTSDRRLFDQSIALKLDPECDVCYAVLEFMEMELKNKDVQNQLIDTLEQVCQLVKYKNEDECKTYVEEIVHLIVDHVDKYLKPAILCPELHLCKASIEA